jgi:hypothetical protein
MFYRISTTKLSSTYDCSSIPWYSGELKVLTIALAYTVYLNMSTTKLSKVDRYGISVSQMTHGYVPLVV